MAPRRSITRRHLLATSAASSILTLDARSYARVYGALSRGGEIDGVRILDGATIDAARTEHRA